LDSAIGAASQRNIVGYLTKPLNMEQLLALIRQVIARKRVEEQLGAEREYSQNLIDSSLDMIISVDRERRIVEFNLAAEKAFGYGKAEVIGKHVDLLYADSAEGLKAHHTALETGRFTGEIVNKRKNGQTFPSLLASSAMQDARGQFLGVMGISRDITEQKTTQEKIENAAREWAITFDSISDLVSIHDNDFKIVRMNKAFAAAFKMDLKSLLGKTCYQVVHGTETPPPDCPHLKTVEIGKATTAELFEPRLEAHLEMSASPIFNDKGEHIASVHIAKDITQRKKMEEQVILTDRLISIGELASGIAHELNNPLTGIIGFSDLVLEKDLSSDVKEDLRVINREAKRTTTIVRNLLTFARKQPADKQSVDINRIIQLVLDLRDYEQKVSNIGVDNQFTSDLPEIVANGAQLQQVFLNIVLNAEYFMIETHGRGTLTVTTERLGDIIRASFADDGPGIAEESLGHLFDPFFTTKEVGKGTGLGLSISYGIIADHGGRIYAESELGKGATFVVELPVATPDKEGEIEIEKS